MPIAVSRSILASICATSIRLVTIKPIHNIVAFIFVRVTPASYIWVDYISTYLYYKENLRTNRPIFMQKMIVLKVEPSSNAPLQDVKVGLRYIKRHHPQAEVH